MFQSKSALYEGNPSIIIGAAYYTSAKASTVLMDVTSPQQANLLIQEGLVLGYVHHHVELFHQDC